MKRRTFIRHSLAAAGAMTFSSSWHQAHAGATKKYVSDRIKLGDSGIEVSRLAMGTGTNGWNKESNQTRKLGLNGLSNLLQAAYDGGVFFWDSADQYGTHPHMKEALKHIPREKVVIMTKTHATTEEEMKADLDRFRKELDTDYIDMVLLHAIKRGDWPEYKKGAMNVLADSRESGIVRAHGISCHSIEALEAAATSDWVQIDLARINPFGVIMDAGVPRVVELLKQMKAQGKGIVGMKIFGAGKLVDKKDECLQYALAQDFIDCFTIGQESHSQFTDLEERIPTASVRG